MSDSSASIDGYGVERSDLCSKALDGRQQELEFVRFAPRETGDGEEIAARLDYGLELREGFWCRRANLEAGLLQQRDAITYECLFPETPTLERMES